MSRTRSSIGPGRRPRDVDREDLAPPGLMHGMRDDDALAPHPIAVTDLLDPGVEEQIRVRPSSGRSRKALTCSSSGAIVLGCPHLEMCGRMSSRTPCCISG
jgi:hypothetical protein